MQNILISLQSYTVLFEDKKFLSSANFMPSHDSLLGTGKSTLRKALCSASENILLALRSLGAHDFNLD